MAFIAGFIDLTGEEQRPNPKRLKLAVKYQPETTAHDLLNRRCCCEECRNTVITWDTIDEVNKKRNAAKRRLALKRLERSFESKSFRDLTNGVWPTFQSVVEDAKPGVEFNTGPILMSELQAIMRELDDVPMPDVLLLDAMSQNGQDRWVPCNEL